MFFSSKDKRPVVSIRRLPSPEKIGVLKPDTPVKGLRKTLEKVMDDIDWKKIVKPNSTVCVKVNGTHFEYLPGITTNPQFVYEFVRILKKRAGRVVVGESDLQRVKGEVALEGCGIKEWAEKADAEVVNFSRLPYDIVDIKGEVLRKMPVPKIYKECDVFAVLPLFKTHKLTGVTIGLKNLFGTITDDHRLIYHSKIDRVLADMNGYLRPKLVITDGIVGLEGDGPIAGLPKRVGLIVGATNTVANDAVVSRIMGFNPANIKHIARAAERGQGPIKLSEINLKGEKISDVKMKFARANQDIISNIEKAIVVSKTISKLVYKSPLFAFNKWVSWKIRERSGYKKQYVEAVKATGLWDNYEGLFH
ncbi:MAG: DUF362 domain-containing protein [Thermoplasmata archaeon]